MESFKTYVDELKRKGAVCDIARAASGLHGSADELLKSDVLARTLVARTLVDLGHADVTFTSSDFVVDDANKTLGQLRLNTAHAGFC